MTIVQLDNTLVPVKNCWVKHRTQNIYGVVIGHRSEDALEFVQVQWGRERKTDWHTVSELCCGFRPGHIVQDKPLSNTRKSLGTGTVLTVQPIAGQEHVIVQLHNTGEIQRIPYENLVRIQDAVTKFISAKATDSTDSDRFRLKTLSYALDSWNQVTGALDRLDVDPLPHQINLVHRIMTSDQANWLIADDVGLGKTIEVGLLLAAKKRQRRQTRRVLIICPAGMVQQWQDEMQHKFNEVFQIYGHDFTVPYASHWSKFEKVIVSIDRAKTDSHKAIFLESGHWDVIIFDEAHHLSKIEHQAITQRYRLAESLRSQTDAFLFLTGTPHQGHTEQFINLLRLLRPDLAKGLTTPFTDPSVIANMVLRNPKSQVTDARGKFLFRGQDTKCVRVSLSAVARDFDEQLQTYLKEGYAASELGGNTGRAIGFVMTTYRKLASSSIAAIEGALQRRLNRLQGIDQNRGVNRARVSFGDESFDEEAFLEGTDGLDDLNNLAEYVPATPFFEDEKHQIAGLLRTAQQVKQDDRKMNQFLSEIVDPLKKADEKLLIFTEYRATQDYLVEALECRYPGSGVTQINGGMDMSEKRHNIDEFNEFKQFMVSTEAGGEGINLHQNCHVLANYDLPWNPRRLVQRAGRLYRYGQSERVIVFNLMANDGFDNEALNKMLARVYSIVQGMSSISPEFQFDVQQVELIGELLERVDIASILAANKTMDLPRTDAEIEKALVLADQAKSQQEKLFSQVSGFDPKAAATLQSLGPKDVLSFLEGVLPYKGIQIRNRLHNGQTLEIQLPEELRGQFSDFPKRATIVSVTVDRQLVTRRRHSDIFPMDFASEFFSWLIDFAKSPGFRGEYASLVGPESGTLALYKIRWQNDQGIPQEEELLSVFLPKDGQEAIANPDLFRSVLVGQEDNSYKTYVANSVERHELLDLLRERANAEIAGRRTKLRHPNDIVLLAAADLAATA